MSTAHPDDRPPNRDDLARALELAPKYDRPGPRYTSYPPAPHFTEAVGADQAKAAYEARTASSPPLSIYVHLPFCESMCTFCGCNVVISRSHAIVSRYLDGLSKNIELVARQHFQLLIHREFSLIYEREYVHRDGKFADAGEMTAFVAVHAELVENALLFRPCLFNELRERSLNFPQLSWMHFEVGMKTNKFGRHAVTVCVSHFGVE